MSKSKTKNRTISAKGPSAQPVDSLAGACFRLLPWILVAATVLFAVAVRIRLLGISLERDEGEYAYTGQLMLQGIPPYKLAYSMKFPGTSAAYAVIMSVFGQTITGIHLGFMLLNAVTIVLIFLLGRRLFTPAAGVAAAAAYALLSIGEGVNGCQAHATHFVVLAALGGTLLLLSGIANQRRSTLLLSGMLYGIAVLMKQHGALFVAFGVLYLVWDQFTHRRDGWLPAAKNLATFLCGVFVPLALTGLVLLCAGVFDKFWFWTFTYAHKYTQEIPLTFKNLWFGPDILNVMGPNLAIWLVALAGVLLIWRKKEFRVSAIFVLCFLVFSFLAIFPGLYFRPHYFVLMLPAIALLSGAAVGAAQKQWPRASWLTYGVYIAAFVFSVVQQREYLFQMSPLEITRAMYGEAPFAEAIPIADYIRTHSAKDARIAVLGSEPEILFYAQRRSVTGHVYMFGLVEDQPYALTMQKEVMHDVETSQPDYVVYVTYDSSWFRRSKSPVDIFDWWSTYQQRHYGQLVGVANLISADHTEYRWGNFGTYQLQSDAAVLIYKRTDPPDRLTAQLNHADALEAQGKLNDAAKEYRQAFAIDPNSCVAHNRLSIVLDKQGLTQDALKELRLSLAIQPEQTTAHTQMGSIFEQMHKFPEAVAEFNQVVRLDPANAIAHTDLAVALFQMGDDEQAVEQFNDAVQIDPANATTRKNLELAQDQLKNKKAENERK